MYVGIPMYILCDEFSFGIHTFCIHTFGIHTFGVHTFGIHTFGIPMVCILFG